MLVLPSIGSRVIKLVLSKNATKAKLYFDDGSTAIISTTNTVNNPTQTVKSAKTVPHAKVKKTVKKPLTEAGSVKVIRGNPMAVPTKMSEQRQKQLEEQRASVLERAKMRSQLLEAETMSASERLGLEAQEGQEVSIS